MSHEKMIQSEYERVLNYYNEALAALQNVVEIERQSIIEARAKSLRFEVIALVGTGLRL